MVSPFQCPVISSNDKYIIVTDLVVFKLLPSLFCALIWKILLPYSKLTILLKSFSGETSIISVFIVKV